MQCAFAIAMMLGLAGALRSEDMGKLLRYYLKEVTTNAALTFVVIFGIVLVSLVYRGIQKTQGADLVGAVMITVLWTADTIPHLFMIALLFGIVLTFARAAADREIIAIAGAGIPHTLPMTAAVLLGIVFTCLQNVTLHYVIPYAHFHKFRVFSDVTRQFILNLGATGDQLQLEGKAKGKGVMIWDHKTPDEHFHDVVIYSRKGWQSSGKGQLRAGLFTAEEAWLVIDPVTDQLRLQFSKLYDVGSSSMAADPSIELDPHALLDKGRRDEGDKDLGSDHVLAEVLRGVHDNPGGARFTVERRAGFAIMTLLLAPIGFCIGVLGKNQGRVTALCFAMVPLFLYYVLDFMSVQLVRLVDTPFWGWMPALVTVVLGAPFCWRVTSR
jgi:lipopolysaccharide export LptBFGC system permease protein LptF